MLKTIVAAIIGLFKSKPQDFETAIGSFNKVVDNLQALATHKADVVTSALKAKEQAEVVLATAKEAFAEAHAEHDAVEKLAQAELERAKEAANKIKALIGSV
jgi:hypothetical protein